MKSSQLSKLLLKWFDQHGRHDLPWQQKINPYRVWVSEIMLQQTQVSTVIPYFNRFMQAFPTINALAKAPEDEVLHLWTGLGYYARARNLHKTAKRVTEEFKSIFPNTLETLITLSGIGRSTAGAILSIAFKIRTPILDGNVRRVLSRLYCVEGPYNNKEIDQTLWTLAEANTPHDRIEDYTQAIMDLGAELCTRSRPNCPSCPLKKQCLAFETNRVGEFPSPKIKAVLKVRRVTLLILVNEKSEILLEKRPAKGIWGSLWSLPEHTGPKTKIKDFCLNEQDCEVISKPITLPSFRHTFTHFHLDIEPVQVQIKASRKETLETNQKIWYSLAKPVKLGLAAPVKKILEELNKNSA
jgi:A/G-specific adenine glycosylase